MIYNTSLWWWTKRMIFFGGGGPTPESESRSNFQLLQFTRTDSWQVSFKVAKKRYHAIITIWTSASKIYKNPIMIHINHINIYHMPTWKRYEFSLTSKSVKVKVTNRQGAERCSDVVVNASGFPPFKARHTKETKDDGETNQTWCSDKNRYIYLCIQNSLLKNNTMYIYIYVGTIMMQKPLLIYSIL